MVSLRPATPNDVPGILAIMNHNILHSTAVYDYDPKNVQEMETWFQEKQEAGWPVIVADENGSVVGYATYGTFRYKQGYRFTVELEIRMLHEKLDHLILHQEQSLIEIQRVQIDMMNDILERLGKK